MSLQDFVQWVEKDQVGLLNQESLEILEWPVQEGALHSAVNPLDKTLEVSTS